MLQDIHFLYFLSQLFLPVTENGLNASKFIQTIHSNSHFLQFWKKLKMKESMHRKRSWPTHRTGMECMQDDNIYRVRSFWSRSLRSGTLRSRSFGSEAKFGHFGRGHYGPGHFGRGHFCQYFRH